MIKTRTVYSYAYNRSLSYYRYLLGLFTSDAKVTQKFNMFYYCVTNFSVLRIHFSHFGIVNASAAVYVL